MLIKQISVFMENRPGRMAEVVEVLAARDIDITALSLADATDFGILRLIADRPEEAEAALRAAGYTVKTTEVLAVSMDDRPGGLASVLHSIAAAQVSIEYMYAFVGKTDGKAVVVMRVSDLEGAVNCLEKDGRGLVTARDIYQA